MPHYADPVEVLIAWASDFLPSENVVDELPSHLVAVLAKGPVHVVERFGGADDVPGLDIARIAWDTYALGRSGALAAAERVRRAVRMTLPGRTVMGCTFSKTATISAPTRRDYRHAQIVLFTASYQLTIHHPI